MRSLPVTSIKGPWELRRRIAHAQPPPLPSGPVAQSHSNHLIQSAARQARSSQWVGGFPLAKRYATNPVLAASPKLVSARSCVRREGLASTSTRRLSRTILFSSGSRLGNYGVIRPSAEAATFRLLTAPSALILAGVTIEVALPNVFLSQGRSLRGSPSVLSPALLGPHDLGLRLLSRASTLRAFAGPKSNMDTTREKHQDGAGMSNSYQPGNDEGGVIPCSIRNGDGEDELADGSRAAALISSGLVESDAGGDGSGHNGSGGDVLPGWPKEEDRLTAVAERLRALPQDEFPPVSGRAAAVLVGLFEDQTGVVRVLLTQRSAQLKSHRGEVCLPGGKRDEEDKDDVATALREAQEELGLDPGRVTVLARLAPVLSKHHLSVTPVVALVPSDLVPRPNPQEVAAAFTVPLAVFLGQFTDPRSSLQTSTGNPPPPASTSSPGGSKTTGRRARARTPPAVSVEAEKRRATLVRWLGKEGLDSPPGFAGTASGPEAAMDEGGHSLGEDVAFANVAHSFRDIRWGEHQYRIHSFQYGEYDVWGLTATICIEAARVAFGRGPSFQECCLGGHHYSAFFWDGAALRVRPCAVLARNMQRLSDIAVTEADATSEAALG